MKWKAIFGIYLTAITFLFGSRVSALGADAPATSPNLEVQEQVTITVTETNKPVLSFGLDKVPELQRTVFEIPLWQFIAFAIYLFLALLAARLIDKVLITQLQRLTERSKTQMDDLILKLLRGPARFFTFVILLQFGLNLFNWPGWLEAWFRKGLYVLLACSITFGVLKLVDFAANYWRRRPSIQTDKTFQDLFIPLISKALKGFIIAMALLLTLDNLGVNIRTLLAGASIGGLALGLAAQDTVGNLFGAAAVFVDQPFKIGDSVQLNGLVGTVEEIGLRSTRIRNPDGHLITIPNKTMGNSTITNVTRRPNIKTVMNIGITYDTSAEKVKQAIEILSETYKSEPMTHDVIIGFNQFADSSLNIMVIHWWKGLDYKEYLAGLQKLNLEIKQRFDQAGIGFAFPSRTVYLRQDNDWRIHGVDVPNRAG